MRAGTSSCSEQALRQGQTLDSGLTDRLRMQSQAFEPAESAAEEVAPQTHDVSPCIGVDAQSLHYRRSLPADRSSLVCSHDSPRPVDELEVVANARRRSWALEMALDRERRTDRVSPGESLSSAFMHGNRLGVQ